MDTESALLVGCSVIAIISVPLALKRVPPNPFYGFRTPRTLANQTLWYRVNCFAGWAFLLASAVGAFLLIALPSAYLAVFRFIYLWRVA